MGEHRQMLGWLQGCEGWKFSCPPSHECDDLHTAHGDDLVSPPVIPHLPLWVGRAGAVAHYYAWRYWFSRGLVTSQGNNIDLRLIHDSENVGFFPPVDRDLWTTVTYRVCPLILFLEFSCPKVIGGNHWFPKWEALDESISYHRNLCEDPRWVHMGDFPYPQFLQTQLPSGIYEDEMTKPNDHSSYFFTLFRSPLHSKPTVILWLCKNQFPCNWHNLISCNWQNKQVM